MSSIIAETALNVTVTGIVIVFLMLILLVIIMSISGSIMARKSKGEKTVVQPSSAPLLPKSATVLPATTPVAEDDDIIAVIAAAVASMYEGTGKRAVIRSIKPSAGTRSVWASAGLAENMRSFF